MIRQRQWISSTGALCILLVVVSGTANAQLPGFPQFPGGLRTDSDDQPAEDLRKLSTDRRVLQQLEELDSAIQGNHATEVRNSLELLRKADAGMLLPDSRGTFIPLHRALALRILQIPSGMHREVLSGTEPSEAQLRSVFLKMDPVEILQMLHQNAGTAAAWRGHLILAAIHRDRGNKILSQFWLSPLLEPTAPDEFRAHAEQLRKSLESSEGKAGADSSPNNSDHISHAKGNTEDSPEDSAARSDGREPLKDLEVRWSSGSMVSPLLRQESVGFVQQQTSGPQRTIPWSAWEPIVNSQWIYARSPGAVTAVDRNSGRQVWTRMFQKPGIVELENPDFPQLPGLPNFPQPNSDQTTPGVELLHRNEVLGQMTEDSERLFAIVRISEATPVTSTPVLIPMLNRVELSPGLCELVALEKSSGRRLWTMGGLPVEERYGNELAGAWFCGPPAVSGNDLYSIVERDGTLSIACLNAATGHLRWSRTLLDPDPSISLDAARQQLAAKTLVQRDLILTTTTSRWVFAADALTRCVLWCRTLPEIPTSNSGQLRLRGRVQMIQPRRFSEVWRSERPILQGDTAVFVSSDSGQLIAVSVTDGRIRLRTTAEKSTVMVYSDTKMFVVASASQLHAWSLPDLEKLWTRKRSGELAVPTGRGARSGDRLVLPLADGSLELLSLKDGQHIRLLKGLRPPHTSTSLIAVPEASDVSETEQPDLVSYSPDQFSLLTSRPTSETSAVDPMQRALFLLDAGRTEDAAGLLTEISQHVLNEDTVRHLKLRIAVARFAASPADATLLASVSELAESGAEKALAVFLSLHHELNRDPATAVQSLIRELQQEEAVPGVWIPEEDSLLASLKTPGDDLLAGTSARSGTPFLRRPLRAWVLMKLREALDRSTPEQRILALEQLQTMPDSVLLQLQSPHTANLCLQRAAQAVEQGTLSESTLHLILAAAESLIPARQSSGNSRAASISNLPAADNVLQILAKLDAAVSAAETMPNADPLQSELARRLIQAVRSEISRELTGADSAIPYETVPVSPQSGFEGDVNYTVIPVSTNLQFRVPGVRNVEPFSDQDMFLNAFDWSISRQPTGLLVKSFSRPELPAWNLQHRPTAANALSSEDQICRFGSILLHHDQTRLSAFSVLERRWLWQRAIPRGFNSRLAIFMNRSFEDFSPGTSNDQRTVAGATRRWICLADDDSIEVLDLLSGESYWKMSDFPNQPRCVACRNAVITYISSDVFVDPLSGRPVAPESPLRGRIENLRFMGSNIDSLVVWNPGTPGGRSVDWIDPISGEVRHSVSLKGSLRSTFLNSQTLAGLSAENQLQLVNLQTGGSQTVSFETDNPDTPELLLTRAAVTADAVNYYVYDRPDMRAMGRWGLFSSNTRMEPVQTQIRAISRKTGKLAWLLTSEGDSMACIHGAPCPVLLYLSGNGRAGAIPPVLPLPGGIPGLPGQGNQRYTLKGISRVTGKQLFSHQTVVQSMSPLLQLTMNPAGQLDLEAFGTRLRLTPEKLTDGK